MKNDALVKGQWSIEKANEWYDSNPWIRGFSGYPSNCVNRIAFWQEYNHKEVFEQIENEFIGCGYGKFKPVVGDAVIEHLRPIREESQRLLKDKAYLEGVYREGAQRASYVAEKTLRKVYKKVGFLPR